MTAFLVVAVLVIGVNTLLWSTVGILRLGAARARRNAPQTQPAPAPADVAVLVAAHDEELVIEATIRSALAVVPEGNVFVVSDGSHDRTAEVARRAGAEVLALQPNRGKAGAIAEAVREFRLADRFEVMLLLDADTQLSPDYLSTGLPLFSEPDVVAVAGRAATQTAPRPDTWWGRTLIAYRDRVYIAMQYLHKFGQAARRVNVVSIVPGFASMYRTRILDRIDIAAPGLTIEDYNMTFEVHAKRLGRIAFRPDAAVAITQDPATLRDYTRQVRRWNLGFWQTVRRHGIHLGVFWLSVALFVAELLLSSLLLVALVPLLAVGTVAALVDPAGELAVTLPPAALLLGVLVPDYLMTVFAAAVARRPSYLVRGLVFPALRILDALLCLRALGAALRGGTDGRWRSPERRAASEPPVVSAGAT